MKRALSPGVQRYEHRTVLLLIINGHRLPQCRLIEFPDFLNGSNTARSKLDDLQLDPDITLRFIFKPEINSLPFVNGNIAPPVECLPHMIAEIALHDGFRESVPVYLALKAGRNCHRMGVIFFTIGTAEIIRKLLLQKRRQFIACDSAAAPAAHHIFHPVSHRNIIRNK